MKNVKILIILFLTLALFLFWPQTSQANPLGTAFTYQGRLVDSNYAANGLYDFKFRLYDDTSIGNQMGSEIDKANVNIIDGYFTMQLDFGSGVFDGNERWLDIGVRPSNQNDPNYILLSPRQKLTPAPYAVYASIASPAVTGGVVPKGGIIMWSGSMANIPSGWALCNGTNDTPDLRDRFIVGAGNSYSVGNTGGEASHTLTIAEMPAHAHSYNRAVSGSGWGGDDGSQSTGNRVENTELSGGGQAHNNLPPYYALAYIMKL